MMEFWIGWALVALGLLGWLVTLLALVGRDPSDTSDLSDKSDIPPPRATPLLPLLVACLLIAASSGCCWPRPAPEPLPYADEGGYRHSCPYRQCWAAESYLFGLSCAMTAIDWWPGRATEIAGKALAEPLDNNDPACTVEQCFARQCMIDHLRRALVYIQAHPERAAKTTSRVMAEYWQWAERIAKGGL